MIYTIPVFESGESLNVGLRIAKAIQRFKIYHHVHISHIKRSILFVILYMNLNHLP